MKTITSENYHSLGMVGNKGKNGKINKQTNT